MKTIGLIGGMSWESSIEYYRIINETVKEKLGGLHSAQNLMHSVDFAEIEVLQHQNRWAEASAILVQAAKNLESGDSDEMKPACYSKIRSQSLEAGVGISYSVFGGDHYVSS